MAPESKRLINIILILFCFFFWGCEEQSGTSDILMRYATYRDIPGITAQETAGIEAIKNQGVSLIYGMPLSTEAFFGEDGEISGFVPLLCDWLTGFFGITFQPKVFDWSDLPALLETGEIDFTGLSAGKNRFESYFYTDLIAQRAVRIMRIENSESLDDIAMSRPLRYVFLEGSDVFEDVSPYLTTPGAYETVFAGDYDSAYQMLIDIYADAFIDLNITEGAFAHFNDIVAEDFTPLVFSSVSMAAANPAYAPVISAVTKAQQNGAMPHLIDLYHRGDDEFKKYKFSLSLNEEEKTYLQNTDSVPLAIQYFNYPIAFYDTHEKRWDGITINLLREAEKLTGFTFRIINDERTEMADLIALLSDGQAYVFSDLVFTPARQPYFLWADYKYMEDQFALLSKENFPNVSINDIPYARVALIKNTAHTEMFNRWFPEAVNAKEYDNSDDAFLALELGDTDLVMAATSKLLWYANYYEFSGYKVNYLFNHSYKSSLAFNREQTVLRSVMDKAFSLIDTDRYVTQWLTKTYDYQAQILAAQRPWLIGAMILSFMVLTLITFLFIRSRNAGKKLDSLVKKRTAELEIATEAAHAANKSKSSFLANMSHEIRTPMNTILGVTEILMQNESLPEEVGEGLSKIYNSSDMLMGIINDILDFSKIEAGKLDIKPYQYFVASLINDSIHLNLMRIGDKSIDFEVMVDENIPAKLIGDEIRIKQVLNNLLSNAFKYTDSGKVVLSVFSNPVTDKPGKDGQDGEIMLNISIRDTGRGMTSGQVEKLFDEYSRFNEESNRTVEGTGLGLSITQRLITLMHGTITVESTPGEGSLFSVNLRQGTVDSEILGKEVATSLQLFRVNNVKLNKRGHIERDPMPYGKVLVVDDVEANLFVAEGLLKPYKLNIETVMNGYDAINKIKDGNKYDIVFMDHMMPGMDGMETTKIIRRLGYTAPIVALTANAVSGQSDLFLQNGFDNFISKPIDLRQLNSILNKLIRDKQHPEVLESARSRQMVSAPDSTAVMHDESTGMSIPGIDIPQGLEKFSGDMEIYMKVLHAYTTSIRSFFDMLENVSAETLIEYQRAVHSIKGTSLDIFAVQIGEKARELEEAARAKNLGFIEKENPAFIENVRKLIYDIENMLSAADAQNAKPRKDRIDRELLQKLHDHCENFDMDGVDAVMAEIERFEYETDGGLSAWLRKQADGVEFESITEKLSGYIK